MQRYKIKIEYDGTPFVGWQFQKNGLSIQKVLQDGIFLFSNEKTIVTGAGRTDSGVHALGQVAHFDLKKKTNSNEIREALNNYLRSNPIAIIKVEKENMDFVVKCERKVDVKHLQEEEQKEESP